MQRLLHHALGRPRRPLAPHPEHRIRGLADESEGLLRHGRVLLAVALDLGVAGAALVLGDGVHDRGNVGAAAPPGRFFYNERQVSSVVFLCINICVCGAPPPACDGCMSKTPDVGGGRVIGNGCGVTNLRTASAAGCLFAHFEGGLGWFIFREEWCTRLSSRCDGMARVGVVFICTSVGWRKVGRRRSCPAKMRFRSATSASNSPVRRGQAAHLHFLAFRDLESDLNIYNNDGYEFVRHLFCA